METVICSECGWECDEGEIRDTEAYGTLCEDCWEIVASEDPTVYWDL